MRVDNPAAMPCDNIEKGPEHDWLRRADGTAECRNCGVRLDKAMAADAFPPPSQVNRKAGAE